MKISKQRLSQIIKEELAKIAETREDHVAGITAKIVRIKKAIENARNGMKNMEAGAVDEMDLQDVMTLPAYWAKQQEVMNLESKLALLGEQLMELSQEVPGRLTRPDEM